MSIELVNTLSFESNDMNIIQKQHYKDNKDFPDFFSTSRIKDMSDPTIQRTNVELSGISGGSFALDTEFYFDVKMSSISGLVTRMYFKFDFTGDADGTNVRYACDTRNWFRYIKLSTGVSDFYHSEPGDFTGSNYYYTDNYEKAYSDAYQNTVYNTTTQETLANATTARELIVPIMEEEFKKMYCIPFSYIMKRNFIDNILTVTAKLKTLAAMTTGTTTDHVPTFANLRLCFDMVRFSPESFQDKLHIKYFSKRQLINFPLLHTFTEVTTPGATSFSKQLNYGIDNVTRLYIWLVDSALIKENNPSLFTKITDLRLELSQNRLPNVDHRMRMHKLEYHRVVDLKGHTLGGVTQGYYLYAVDLSPQLIKNTFDCGNKMSFMKNIDLYLKGTVASGATAYNLVIMANYSGNLEIDTSKGLINSTISWRSISDHGL